MLILDWIPINLRVLGCWCGRHLVLQIWVCILQLYNPVSPKWGNLSHHGDTCIDNPTTLSRRQEQHIPIKTYTVHDLQCLHRALKSLGPTIFSPWQSHIQSVQRNLGPRCLVGSSTTLNLASLIEPLEERKKNITCWVMLLLLIFFIRPQSFGNSGETKHNKTACLSGCFTTPSLNHFTFLPESTDRIPCTPCYQKSISRGLRTADWSVDLSSGLFCRDSPLCQEVVLVVVLTTAEPSIPTNVTWECDLSGVKICVSTVHKSLKNYAQGINKW